MKSIYLIFLVISAVTPVGLWPSLTFANEQLVASEQTQQLKEDNTVNIVLNAATKQNKKLSYAIAQQPKHGSAVVQGTNVVYSPEPDFSGVDTFQYFATNGVDNSASALVKLNIQPVNDRPVAQPQNLVVAMDKTSSITLIAKDADNDPIRYVISTPPKYGHIELKGNIAKYTPKSSNNKGMDRFSYIAKDHRSESKAAKILLFRGDVCPEPKTFEQGVCVLSSTPMISSNDVPQN